MTPRLADALVGAECLHDRATLDAAIARMADAIHADYAADAVPPLVST